MANSLNRNSLNGDSIVGVISSEKFSELAPELQNKVLENLDNGNQRDGGVLGKFFGNKKEIASMNIAVTICIILLFICGIDVIHSICVNEELHMDLISTIIPVVSLALGFIFGKGTGKED